MNEAKRIKYVKKITELRIKADELADELEAETNKPVERNDDGDSLEDMQKVQSMYGRASIEIESTTGAWLDGAGDRALLQFIFPARDYRITAKHSDTFNQDCMDFETWATAVIDRGMIARVAYGTKVEYMTHSNGRDMLSGIDKDDMDSFWRFDSQGETPTETATWTAITHEQCGQETERTYTQKEVDRLVRNARNRALGEAIAKLEEM